MPQSGRRARPLETDRFIFCPQFRRNALDAGGIWLLAQRKMRCVRDVRMLLQSHLLQCREYDFTNIYDRWVSIRFVQFFPQYSVKRIYILFIRFYPLSPCRYLLIGGVALQEEGTVSVSATVGCMTTGVRHGRQLTWLRWLSSSACICIWHMSSIGT